MGCRENTLEEFLIEVKIEDYKIERTFLGTEMEGKNTYIPLLDEIPKLAEIAKQENYHVTVAENFVDVNAGSGLVHLSRQMEKKITTLQ